MAWFESHQSLERHPKTHELMGEMGWDLDTAIGKLSRFWWWALDYAPTGDVGKYNDAVLAGSVGLAAKDGEAFKIAMLKARWLERREGTLLIHDWRDYAGRYLRETKFKHHPEKWAEVCHLYPKEVQGQSLDSPRYQPTNQPTNPPTTGGVGGRKEAKKAKILSSMRVSNDT